MDRTVSRFALAGLASLACLLTGCALLFGKQVDPDSRMISPDGSKAIWRVVEVRSPLYVGRVAGNEPPRQLMAVHGPAYWARDSRHVVVQAERSGKQSDILVFDSERPQQEPLNLTPWSGARSVVVPGALSADKVYFASNRRDDAVFDLYAGDIASGAAELVFRNPGDVVQWIADVDGTIGARVRQQDEQYILQVMNPSTHTWRSVYHWTDDNKLTPERIDRANGEFLAVAKKVKYQASR
ncbi:TolB-like translocation protein [Noviherbaspirillum galbum]|uniref:Lipoprotein n=1 Tax=Noviherbaspirillum galbum TaxID=2709383 RepID=A0A6B3STI1_9BURK|nr:hypothetical protein [Noviherbaspirillum galbum]NEX63798.1 hypothetical protein [Noviherbaspirillum galbum]